MADTIVTIILILVVAFAIFCLIRKRKKGIGCCGCSYAGNCSDNCTCNKKQ